MQPDDKNQDESGTPLAPEDTPTQFTPPAHGEPGRGAGEQADSGRGGASSSPNDAKTTHTDEAPTIFPQTSGEAAPARPDVTSSRSGPAFPPETILASRYRIVRYIAKGGMGEVYEAEDLTLKGRVALKTILPEIARNATSVERFRREIAIARRITHPNVSRIYDIGTHGETMFLTMEFLAGEDLRHRILRRGKLTENEALPIVEQIAAGLQAAHDVGIIHRDFKSANVMLVPGPSGKGERAVVTDFGLARPQRKEEGMETLSESGAVVGTPAYMAPEQVEGLELTAAVDTYALGITLYEMLTGKRPFEGSSAFSTAVKRLTEAPPPPRVHVPEISETWEAVILRCLAKDPAERFASAADVAHALRGDETPTAMFHSASATPASGSQRKLPLPLIAAIVVLSGILAIFAWQTWRPEPATESASANTSADAPVALRSAVAVLGLRNNSGAEDANWISGAVSEMLSTELAADGKVRVAPGQEIARVKADIGLSEPDSLSNDDLAGIRNRLGVGSVVTGSYTIVGDAGSRLLRIDLKLLDASSGEVLATSGTSGTELQLFDLVTRAGGGLRQKLGLGELSPEQVVAVQATLPSNAEAVRRYTEGLTELRALDAPDAKTSLTKAAEADPEHALTWAALSAAHEALGEPDLARETAAKAVALGDRLGREQQLQIVMRMHETSQEWSKAVEAGTTLWESYPDNIDYGLALANAQISAGKTNEALVTINAMRSLPSPLSRDGRIDLAEARAWQETGDFEKQKTLAAAAATRGRETGATLLTAHAHMLEASALLRLGSLDESATSADSARALFESAGDRGNVARAIEIKALAVGQKGDYEGERRLFVQALEIHRGLGDRLSMARVQLNIGRVLMHQGNVDDAEQYFVDSLAAFEEAGAKYPAAIAMNDIGAMAFYRGNLKLAEKHYKEALALFSEVGEKGGTAISLTNIAEVLACRGELQNALSFHQDSLAINRTIGDKVGEAYDLFRIGEVHAQRGDFIAARSRFDEALTIQNEIGERYGASETKVALARLAIDEGEPEKAEPLAREAEQILRSEGAVEQSYMAMAVLAESLHRQGKTAEALVAANAAWTGGETSEDRRIRYYTATTVARVRAAAGGNRGTNDALQLLETTITQARSEQFIVASFEARLAAAEIALAGDRASGERRLTAVQKEAAALGLLRISRVASSSATSNAS